MRAVVILLLALASSGCVPLVYGARYEHESRQNLPDAVPASIVAGRTTAVEALLALGDPDTVAADWSWAAWVSSYQEGGAGVVMVLVGAGQAGMLGGARTQMLYRRLLLRFDAAGLVTAATLDVVHCAETEVFIGNDYGAMPPCFDVDSRDVAAAAFVGRLQLQGETNIVVFPRAEWLTTQQQGMVVVSDTALHFVAAVDDRGTGSPGVDLALADLTHAEPVGMVFHLAPAGRQRVVLRRGEEEVGAFVVRVAEGDDPRRTTEALELVRERIAAARR